MRPHPLSILMLLPLVGQERATQDSSTDAEERACAAGHLVADFGVQHAHEAAGTFLAGLAWHGWLLRGVTGLLLELLLRWVAGLLLWRVAGLLGWVAGLLRRVAGLLLWRVARLLRWVAGLLRWRVARLLLLGIAR
jgi:hypothetical protein